MKTRISNTILAAMILVGIFKSSLGFNQKLSNAKDYHEYISKEYSSVSVDLWNYLSLTAPLKKVLPAEKDRKELAKAVQAAINKISALSDFSGNTSLKDSVISFLKLSQGIINQDYEGISKLENGIDQSYESMETYLRTKEKAINKLNAACKIVDAEENKFASTNNIIMEGKEKNKNKIDDFIFSYNYFNEVYLIFFKGFKQEFALFEAEKNANLKSLEPAKNILVLSNSEGTKKLEGIQEDKENLKLKSVCGEMLKFYEAASQENYTNATNYLIEKDKFDKIRIPWEKKKENQKSQRDGDIYNAALEAVTNAYNKFIDSNKKLTLARSKAVEKWNWTLEKFSDKYLGKKL